MRLFGRRTPGESGSVPPASQNLIQTPDLARKLVTRYGIRERSPAPTLAAEVVPVVLVDDLIGESDLIVPRIRPACGFVVGSPAAATMSVTLSNPAGSRTIVHLYYFFVETFATAIDRLSIRAHGGPIGGAVEQTTKGFRNTLLGGQAPVAKLFADTALYGGGVLLSRTRVAINQQPLIPFDFVISEGTFLTFENATAATTECTVSLFWSEETVER